MRLYHNTELCPAHKGGLWCWDVSSGDGGEGILNVVAIEGGSFFVTKACGACILSEAPLP